MFSETVIVVDVSNLAHRNWHALNVHKENCVIYGLLRDIGTLSRLFQSTLFAFCFDGKIDLNPRRLLLPSYKANREWNADRESIAIQIHDLRCRVLPSLDYKSLYYRGDCEADDLIAVITGHRLPNVRYIIVSSDTDLFQLVDHITSIWNPVKKCMITPDWIRKRHGIHPDSWIEYKAVIGDATDNISGVRGIGVLTAEKIISGKEVTENIQKKLQDDAETIQRNKRLMRLPYDGIQGLNVNDFPPIEKSDLTYARWNEVCLELDMEKLCGAYPNV